MATVLTVAVVLLSIVILSWLFVLHRAILKLHRQLRELTTPNAPPKNEKPTQVSDSKVPRQIVHDLNNLLSTMGGFAEAALEDVPDGDPIHNDLKEISDAAERAKGVVKRLSDLTPKPARRDNTLSMSDFSALKRVTSTYEIPKKRSSEPVSSYPFSPVVKPVSAYRRESRPPMATPVPSTVLSSYPSPIKSNAVDDIRKTSSFPAQRTSAVGTRHSSITPKRRDWVIDNKKQSPPMLKHEERNFKPRLMIVDDEIQLLTMFRRVFEPQGYDVTTYSNSLEAWNAFQKDATRYDLAILDQRMPEMSGSSLATEMIAIRPDFPIILLTGYSETVSPDDAARIGIRKYLSKPIPQAKLSATIRTILNETLL